MSGCCGQGPVIVSGAAATPRLDVETVLLCDVLPDGTVAGVALVEPVYDTNTGVRLATRTVDPVTGAAYTPAGALQACQPDDCNATTTSLVLCDTAGDGTVTHFVRATTYDCAGLLLASLDRTLDGAPYTVSGTVGACPASPDCESPTTPVTSVGLCLADGTPIAVTVTRDCTGAVVSEGWLNLTTGAWSAGTVPAGTVACGDSRSIQVSGTFCDVDPDTGVVLGLVLVEYTYDDTGAIAAVRLVDAVTGDTYTPTGTVTVCPAGVEQPERDLLQLCDTATDGTVTEFVRDYARDENGAITGHTDYALDGTPYTPAGTVGVCGGTAEECRDTSTVLVCDVPAESSATITPTIVDGTLADVGQTQFQTHPGPWEPLWSGGTLVFPAGPGPAQEHLGVVGQITGDMSACEGASGTLKISVRVRNDGPDAGQAWDGSLRLFRGTTLIAAHDALTWAPAGWQGTLTVSTPITAAEVAAGDIRAALVLETYHLGAKSWTADQFTASLELEGCEATTSTQFLRTLLTDCETGEVVSTTDTTLDGQPYTVTGTVGQCTPAGGGTSDERRDCEQSVLCDVTEEDGTHSFLRTVCRDASGAVLSVLDTELDGTTAYSVAGTAGRCCDVTVLSDCTYSRPDSSTGFSFTNPAYPGCWVAEAGAPTYTFGDRVTSFAATYQSDTASGSVIRFSSPDLGGLIPFDAFTPALPVQPANSAADYVGTAVINGVTVTLTAVGGDGLSRWSAFTTGVTVFPGDGFRIEFSEPVELQLITSAFGDPVTNNERLCAVAFETVPWVATRRADCVGNITALDAVTGEPVPDGVTLDCAAPGEEECATTSVQTIRLCDLDPTVEPDEDGRRCAVPFLRHLAYDCDGALLTFHDTGLDGTTPYEPVQVVDCQCMSGEGVTSSIEVPWQTVSVVEDPAGIAGQDFIYTVAPETDPSRVGTIRVHVSRPAGGACGAYDINNLVFSNTAAYTLTLDAVAQEMSYLRVDLLDFDTFEPVGISSGSSEPTRLGGTAGWNAAHTRIVPAENNGTGYMYWDNPPETVAWTVFNQGGGVSCGALSFQGMTVEPGGCCGGDEGSGCTECDTVALCDVPAGGGATVSFLRTLCRDCTGAVTSVTDTELDGTTPYTPTGTVTSCATIPDCPTTYGTECWKFVEAQVAYDNTVGNCGTISPGSMPACAGNWRITSWIIDGVEQITGAPVAFTANGCGGNANQFHGAWAAALGTIDPSSTWQPAYNGSCLHFIRTASVDPNRVYGPMVMFRTEAPAQVFTIGPAASRTERQYTKTFVQECDGSTTVQWLDADGNEIPQPTEDLTSCGVASTLAAPSDPDTAMPVGTAIRRLTADGVFDASSLGVLQSVTVLVLAGSATVATSDGTAEVPAGASLSWSVVTGQDSAVGGLTVSTGTGDDVLVTATYK